MISQNLSLFCPSNLDQALGIFLLNAEEEETRRSQLEKNLKIACEV